MEYYIPPQRENPIAKLMQIQQLQEYMGQRQTNMQWPQQHQNPLAQFMGMRQPNALSRYLQPEAGSDPGMAWLMRQRLGRQGRQGAPDMLPILWAMRRGSGVGAYGPQQQSGRPFDDPWGF